jgi:hypothetical protein
VVKFLVDEPQQITAWATGSEGERLLAESLMRRLGQHAMPLLDRKVPGTRGNIDLLFIASSGVWVIDAKKYRGPVERRDKGGPFKTEYHLYINRRDRTTLIDGLGWQLNAVRTALVGSDPPIYAVLCLVDAEWKFFAKPFQLNSVWVSPARGLAEMIAAPGPLTERDRTDIAERLAAALPPAVHPT